MVKEVLSILIPSYNDDRILHLLDSINCSSFRSRARIIIQDSCSNSDLLEKIKSKLSDRDVLRSEKDSGIFDGLNKLLENIDTDLFTMIGSDDIINDHYNLEAVIELFDRGAEIIQSNVVYLKKDYWTTSRVIWAENNDYMQYILGKPFYHFGSTISTRFYHSNKILFKVSKEYASDFIFFKELIRKSSKGSEKCTKSVIYLGEGGKSGESLIARLNSYWVMSSCYLNRKFFLLPVFLLVRIVYKIRSKLFLSKRLSRMYLHMGLRNR